MSEDEKDPLAELEAALEEYEAAQREIEAQRRQTWAQSGLDAVMQEVKAQAFSPNDELVFSQKEAEATITPAHAEYGLGEDSMYGQVTLRLVRFVCRLGGSSAFLMWHNRLNLVAEDGSVISEMSEMGEGVNVTTLSAQELQHKITTWLTAQAQTRRERAQAELQRVKQEEMRRATLPAFSYRNSRGQVYYLHKRQITLKTGRIQEIHFFARDIRSGALHDLPEGYTVLETKVTGMPVLARKS